MPMADDSGRAAPIDAVIRFCLENKLVVALGVLFVVAWGVLVAPFDWEIEGVERGPVPVDAIPDIGENQQIVFTRWPGRSPQDVEDQISYPLTVALLNVPGVKTVRSRSMFGFSSIYIIFEEGVEFYWSRSRVLERLNSLPADTLPRGVQPMLGPDATALGQVFWYTLEGRDPDGQPAGGWDLNELRSVQDWTVRYGLARAPGVAEVASVGGFVREYQIDVDPAAMRTHGVTLEQVVRAVQMSNIDVGARTIEVNRVEYVIRGLGFLRSVADIEATVVKASEDVPLYVRDVGHVTLGPALRRGALDKEGAEAVGGVAVVRYGFNPLEAIRNVKEEIARIAPGLPKKAVVDYERASAAEVRAFAENAIARPVIDRDRASDDQLRRFAEARGFEAFRNDAFDEAAWLAWMRETPRGEWPRWLSSEGFSAYAGGELNQAGWLWWLGSVPRERWPDWVTTSQVTVVPFYDRTGLIYETLGTLSTALTEEMLVTIIVVLVVVLHLRSSVLISSSLPLAVLLCFIAMKLFGVDANIVALSGIAIAIGTIVDMGIIVCENILTHLNAAGPDENRLEVVSRGASEVGGAVLTAVSTTVISFLPVFTMTGAEGKLFRPLAFTKTFALVASVLVALIVIPPAAHALFTWRIRRQALRRCFLGGVAAGGVALMAAFGWLWAGGALAAVGGYFLAAEFLPGSVRRWVPLAATAAAVVLVGVLLTRHWLPLGPAKGFARNFIFVAVLIGGLLGFFRLFQWAYGPILRWFLVHKAIFLVIPAVIVLAGGLAWLGFETTFGFVPAAAERTGLGGRAVRETTLWTGLSRHFPGLGREFMPPLDEGSFLLMPTTMPHASIGECLDVLAKQDRAIRAIPEVDGVVGKIGRVDSPLDPAPISMIETVITYKPEYRTDEAGRRRRFKYDPGAGAFVRTEDGKLIEDADGRPYRQWRDHIKSPDDIWDEIVATSRIPGTTSAPKLQPIAARLVMLQSGMRAPMGVKITGPDLPTIERVGFRIEELLRQVDGVEPATVVADRIVGKPYIEIDIDREAIARHNIHVRRVQDVIEVGLGGRRITTTVEGRERYPVRIRYQRELRDRIEELGRTIVPAPDGTQVPLGQLADIRYVRGPQVIKGEDTRLVGYVVFDKKAGRAEVDVVEACRAHLAAQREAGAFQVPAGVSYEFAGSYENQQRAQRRLRIVLPVALFVIFIILYLQFRSVPTTLLVFSGIVVAWAGGFLLIWLYNQPWFLDVVVFGVNLRELFQMPPVDPATGRVVARVNLSVAVWVGFLALFGIASDNGVVLATYLRQSFARRGPESAAEVREATVAGSLRRIRPCLMTSATTILALIPVLTSTGRGSDVMVPMAIPSFGGMLVVLVSVFVVPVLYCWIEEARLRVRRAGDSGGRGI
jgi:Cu(I)/Ag(I) efflux system membrane protein CusA/SilA